MRLDTERRWFFTLVGLILLLPGVGAPVGAFGGLEGLAALFHVDGPIVLSPNVRNTVRAICWMFVIPVPLVIWSLSAMHERAGAFRIVVVCGFGAGFARLTGWFVDGAPGLVPTLIMGIELVGMPVLYLWHARLLRLTAPQPRRG